MIDLQNLWVDCRTFRLQDITLKIEANEFFVLMGPTGAGKTVLLEAVAGLMPASRGQIIIRAWILPRRRPKAGGWGSFTRILPCFPI
jgi:molybdate/tungstate transport system ATP-binding protein